MCDTPKMKHHSVGQWADFVRNLVAPAEAAVMREHLDSCRECRATVQGFEALNEVAALDNRISIPPEVTRRARALFDIQSPKRDWLAALRKLTARLVSDSSVDPLPAGVRAGEATGAGTVRQVTYRAGDYDVDLRLELAGDGGSEVVGQIVNRAGGRAQFEGSLVQVIAGGRTVGETETNQFGEFVLDRPVRPAGTLRISLRQAGFQVDLPLRAGKRG